MKFNINKILPEWAYRVHDGQPDVSNPDHVNHLREILYNFGLPHKFIVEYVHGLTEGTYVDNSMNVKLNRVGKKWGSTGKVTSTPDTEKTKTTPAGEDSEVKAIKNATVEKNIKDASNVNKELGDKINKAKGSEKEGLQAEYLANQLDNMIKVSSIDKGKGRYHMTKKDYKSYRDYLQKISADPVNGAKKIIDTIKQEQEKKYGPITEESIDKFIKDLELASKSGDPDFVKSIKTKIKGKGGPGSSYTTGSIGEARYRNVIKAYLETGGISPITGEVVPFSEAQLDHITSLSNWDDPDTPGDNPNNWMFMEERFNQFKGKKTHAQVRADVESTYYRTDAEIAAGKEGKDVEKLLIQEDIGWFQGKFNDAKGSDNPREIGLTKSQIEKMNKHELNNIVKAFNLATPDTPELARYENPTVEFGGKKLSFARGQGKDKPVRPEEDDKNTWGLTVKDDNTVVQDKDIGYEASLKAYNDNRASGARLKKADVFVKLFLTPPPKGYGLASDSTKLDELFDSALKSHRSEQAKSVTDIKKKIKAVQALPGSHKIKEREVRSALRDWIKGDPEPFGKNDPDNDHITNSKTRKKLKKWQEWKDRYNNRRYELWSEYEDNQ